MKERYRNLPHAPRSVFGAPTEATARYSNFLRVFPAAPTL
jgi:hypothetical protein